MAKEIKIARIIEERRRREGLDRNCDSRTNGI